MSLIPKITVTAVDKILGKSVTLQDTTGAYNAGTNPGGYGAPNYATTDLDWAILRFRNYTDANYTDQKLSSLTAILGSGQSVSGLVDGVFASGTYELKYYPVVAHPVTPNVDTSVTWTVGSKTFNLNSADTLLAGVSAILIKNLSDTKLYFLDPDVAATNTQATVTEVLPSAGTGFIALAYEADTRFLAVAQADDCIAKQTGKIICDCNCFSPEMQELYLMMGKRQGADVHFTKGNYQAAHDIITQIAARCDNNLNCDCS